MPANHTSVNHASVNVWRIFAMAFVLGCIAAFLAIVIGMKWLIFAYPESNIAPVLAFILFAPAAFIVVFVATFIVELVRKVSWTDNSGHPLTIQLLRGNAPLSIAFLTPLALLICLQLVTMFGAAFVYYAYYPLFRGLMILVELIVCLAWVWMIWRNAQNTASAIVGKLAKGFSILWTIWVLSGLFVSILRA